MATCTDQDKKEEKPPKDESDKSADPKPKPGSDTNPSADNKGQDQSQKQNSNPSSEKSSSSSTVGIVAGSVVGGLVLAFVIPTIFIIRRRQKRAESIETPPPSSNLQKKSGIKEAEATPHSEQSASAAAAAGGGKADNMKLTFVRDDRQKFDLPDLLKASAEILGSGCFGSSYKAALLTGTMVMVVKRFKQMNNVGREEFQEHMRRIGRLRHPNLLPLVAYYYRKEEKLLVTDFVEKGSLAVNLHGKHLHHTSFLITD